MRGVLVVNTGSSSIKFGLYRLDGAAQPAPVVRGNLSGLPETLHIGLNPASNALQGRLTAALAGTAHDTQSIITALCVSIAQSHSDLPIAIVGHRIVHGGLDFHGPALATPEAIEKLEALIPFAPSHQPHNLVGHAAIAALWPDMPQSFSFDTAFHADMPRESRLYAIPRDLIDKGLVRYGFHGLSYAYIASVLPDILGDRPHARTIVAHLGSGGSLCALSNGRSVATTMGLTALAGIPMATRSGDIDPGLVLHLIENESLSPAEVSALLYQRSGLLGLSGETGDMRALLASHSDQSREALAVYAHRIAREIGALATDMGGVDAVVFTGGVGEHAAPVRADICRRIQWLGATLDPGANARDAIIFSSPGSRLALAAIPTDEELVIAREAAEVLEGSGG